MPMGMSMNALGRASGKEGTIAAATGQEQTGEWENGALVATDKDGVVEDEIKSSP